MKQVPGCRELLDTARDCFYFTTRFFEVVSVSATHIYHSALELSPVSSVVRSLYHHQRPTLSPKVVIGTPESWKPNVPISNKDSPYRSCTWSPCGRFVTAQTQDVVEVRDPLTSELLSTLQPSKSAPKLTGPLAYSPDGCSLCCVSNTAIIIWDTQTGGVAKQIECHDVLDSSCLLVWSLDGRTIGVTHGEYYIHIVATYDVSSGKTLSHDTLCSEDEPFLWAHDKSFRIMETSHIGTGRTIHIFEVGPALAQVRSFHISVGRWCVYRIESYSPTSCHVSISVTEGGGHLLILGDQVDQNLLAQEGHSNSHCFSSDGSLFVASVKSGIRVWKCTGSPFPRYFPWREFRNQGWPSDNFGLRFSPTLLSISGRSGVNFQVWHFDDCPTAPVAGRGQHVAFSPHGTCIVTADPWASTVTITNFISQTPPPLHRHGYNNIWMALTGNILVVVGSDTC